MVIADGWLGTDDVVVDFKGRGNYLHKQFVSRAITEAEALGALAPGSKNSTMGGKRLELMPTAFPHEEGLPIRMGDSIRYAGRITFNEVTV
jgi:hypothetical protein